FDAPSHVLLHAVAAEPRFAGRIPLRADPVLPAQRYYDLLAPILGNVDVWETQYVHVLEGDDAVLAWTRGTAFLPVEAALDGDDLDAFVDAYRARLRAAYPKRKDDKTLFPFRRVFIVGVRSVPA